MRSVHHPFYFLFLLATCFFHQFVASAIEVGDQVCLTGYIMDIYCIQLGHLLDNPSITTLKEPENHSFHCLFDEAVCYNSGFVVLGEKDSDTSLHCLGLRLDESDVVMVAGRAAGRSGEGSSTHIACASCIGDASKPVAGYRATITGTVKDLGDGSTGLSGQPVLNNIELTDFDVGCAADGTAIILVKDTGDGGGCRILSSGMTSPSPVSSSFQFPTTSPSGVPSDSSSPTYSPSTTSNPSTSSVPSESVGPSLSPSESHVPSVSTLPSDSPLLPPMDCTKHFCEETLSDDYLLRYRLNVEDAIITMELVYDGEAWVAIAFSEDDKMAGSDAVIGSPDDRNVQKYRLLAGTPVVDSAIELMLDEEQTLINATIDVEDGKTVMKFTKVLQELGQIEIKYGLNNMLWAYGLSNTLGYHALRSPFTLNVSPGGSEDSVAPSFVESVALSQASTSCTPWPDAAWLQPNFCSYLFVSELSKPRGLHIDHSSDEILLVEKESSRVVRIVSDIDAGTVNVVPLSQTEGLMLNHGIELSGGYLYASSETNVYRWPYFDGTAGEVQEVIVGIQPGGHFTRTLAFDGEGKWLYISIGSGGNIDSDSSRSRILRFDISAWDGLTPLTFNVDGELFADGLRNEVGLAFDVHGDLWGVENGADNLERDDLGGDIHNENPSEELNRFRQEQAGQSWGYPYCWSEYCVPLENGGSGIKGANTRWVWPTFIDAGYTDEWCRESTNESMMSMPAHSAPLGITFYKWNDMSQDSSCEGGFPKSMDNFAFIAFHGSWNSDSPTGYKVVFVPMDGDGNPTHQPIDLFRHAGDGAEWPDPGIRPVDVQFDRCGRLYVTEDLTGSLIQIRYGGRYTDNFEPIGKDVNDGASCAVPVQSNVTYHDVTLSPSNGSKTSQTDAPSSNPLFSKALSEQSSYSNEIVPKQVNNHMSHSCRLDLYWWPTYIILLLFQWF